MHNKQAQRLRRGAVDVKTLVIVVLGLVLIYVGASVLSHAELAFMELNIGKTVTNIGVMLLVFPVIKMFFLDPLASDINNRNRELESTFTEAENLRLQMQTMRNEYETRLQETEAQAREQIQASIREAQQLRQNLMAEAAERADALVLEAQQKIEQERDRIIGDLRLQVVDLTLAAAQKVIGENMNNERNRRLVGEFIDQVEVAR
ncbi:MAG TPA: F0F1 ATP synthase subunit B [Fimbriimonas sp.]